MMGATHPKGGTHRIADLPMTIPLPEPKSIRFRLGPLPARLSGTHNLSEGDTREVTM